MISVPKPVKISVHEDQSKRQVIINNSPIKLGRGGKAKLARVAINHHIVIKGRRICKPRARTMVRL